MRSAFYGLNGKNLEFVRGKFSKFAIGGISQDNPVCNYYRTTLSTLDRGLDLWKVDYTAVKTGKYNEGFAFANRYSYYKQPQTSPYAFIALRDVLNSADIFCFQKNKYEKVVQRNAERVRIIKSEFKQYRAKPVDLEADTML